MEFFIVLGKAKLPSPQLSTEISQELPPQGDFKLNTNGIASKYLGIDTIATIIRDNCGVQKAACVED